MSMRFRADVLPTKGRCSHCGEDLSSLPASAREQHVADCAKLAARVAAGDKADCAGLAARVEAGDKAPAAAPLWRLAGELRPAEYIASAFADLVPIAAREDATPEGLRCAACAHYADLTCGAVCDESGAVRCAHCAACSQLLAPPSAPFGRPTGGGGVACEAIALRDLSSASAHLRGLLLADGEPARALEASMERSGLQLVDLAAHGVLSAFDAAAEIVASGRAEREVLGALVEQWEAQVPTGL